MYHSSHTEGLFAGLSPSSQVEPMALGASSPGNSPSSPVTASGQYLPSFLIGGSSSSSPFVWPGSPSKQQHQQSFTVSPPSPLQPALPQATTQTPRSYVGRLGGDKHSGPPVQGLLESLNSPVQTTMSVTSTPAQPGTPLSSFHGPQGSSLRPRPLFSQGSGVGMSPAQVDPFYTQRESLTLDDQLDETWVTVFGFPPAAASYILQQFSQYGTIIEHKLDPKGNWVHLHYQSKLQAKKAISKNGKVFGDSIMIGVKSCIEKNLIDESFKENAVMSSSAGPCSDHSVSSSWTNESRWGTASERSIANMRPLTQAYKVSASERDVKSPQRIPQKNNNIISRTMDYMFGW